MNQESDLTCSTNKTKELGGDRFGVQARRRVGDAVGRKSRRGERIPPRWLDRAGFEPCVRVAIAQRVIVVRPIQTRRGGASTARLKTGAELF